MRQVWIRHQIVETAGNTTKYDVLRFYQQTTATCGLRSKTDCCHTYYHDVEDDSEAPDVVRSAVVWNALQNLRCSVRSTAAVRTTQLVSLLWPRKPEVRQFYVVLDVQKHVLAFQVPPQAQTHLQRDSVLAFLTSESSGVFRGGRWCDRPRPLA